MRGKKHILISKQSELLSEVNEVVKRTHMSSRSSTLQELLKKLNLPSHWIRLIPSFQIREQAMTIDSTASKSSYIRLISL